MKTRKMTTPVPPESPDLERKSAWRKDHLHCVSGLANGRADVLEIGRNDRGSVRR